MGVALKEPMTLAAFLEWEERQEAKYEFDGFAPVAMVGVSGPHALIQGNLMGLLFNRLRGHRCRVIGSDLKILVAGRIRYPDAFIVCSAVPIDARPIEDPVVVFEILIPGSDWVANVLTGDAVLDLPEIGSSIPLAELYEGVQFPPDERPKVSGA